MNTFNYKPLSTEAVTISIQAESEERAYEKLVLKLEILESMGVFVPDAISWFVVTQY